MWFVPKKYLDLFFYSLLTYIALGAIYPERFIFADIRFTSSHTVANFYQAALFHSKYLKNLEFTFWNFFDQSNTTFYHLAQGFYNLQALVEGFIYNILSFFKSDNFFRVFHSHFIQFFFILFRTLGITLIFDIYRVQKYLYLPLILFINILISSVISFGYELGWLLSITPILIYYLIKFLRNNNIVPLIFFLIFYVFIFSQIPLMSLSYFFPPFHLIITLYFLVMLYKYFFNRNNFQSEYKNFLSVNFSYNYYFYLFFFSLLILVTFNISFFLVVNETSALTGTAGYDGNPTESRLNNFLNPEKFFKTYIPNARCIFDDDTAITTCSIFNFISYYLTLDVLIAIMVSICYLPSQVYAMRYYYMSTNRFHTMLYGFTIASMALLTQEILGHWCGGDDPSRLEGIPNAIWHAGYYSIWHLIHY